MAKILVVEDNHDYQELLQNFLENAHHEITTAGDGESALELTAALPFDLILLDLMLPGLDGFDVCRSIREKCDTPVIMLTALGSESCQMRGYGLHIDDYITKPFKLNELLSRIKALLRRSAGFSQSVFLEANGIKVDLMERLVWKNGVLLNLPLVEYKLLCLLMRNPNHLLTRETILDSLWDGAGNYVDDNTLSVYVRRLRNKIEETPNAPQHLLTERGIGYKWVVE